MKLEDQSRIVVDSDDLQAVANYQYRTITGTIRATAGEEQAETQLSLRLLNPCYDSSLIRIEPSDVEEIPDYILLTPPKFYYFDSFKVVKISDKFEESFCGRLQHVVKINGEELKINSSPVSYNAVQRKITVFAAQPKEQGIQIVEIIGRFSRYRDVTVEVRRDFSIIVEVCQLTQLIMVDEKPIQDMIQLLGQAPQLVTFNLPDMV